MRGSACKALRRWVVALSFAAGFVLAMALPPAARAQTALPFQEDFTSPVLSNYWTLRSTGCGRIQVTGSLQPRSGAYHLLMDTTNGYALNEAVLTLDLTGRTNVMLDVWVRSFSDEAEGLPEQFTGSVNGDGIAVSPDGTNWWRLADLGYAATYERLTADLSAWAAAQGLALGAGLKIKFQQYDNFPVSTDGRGFDYLQVYEAESAADVAVGLRESRDPAVVGEPWTLTVAVTNMGAAAAAEVVASLRCPAAAAIVDVDASQGACLVSNEWVTAEFGALAGGAEATVDVVLQTPARGVAVSQVSAATATFDAQPFNQSVTEETLVDQTGGDLRFATGAYSAGEGDGEVALTVVRTNRFAGALTVTYDTADGTALAGPDYEAGHGLVALTNGQRSAVVTVQLANDTVAEAAEQFEVRLSGATGGAQLVGPSNATVEILDEDGVAALPFEEHFDALAFSNVWTRFSTTPGRVQISTNSGAYDGARHVYMDSGDFSYALNELTLAVDLAGYEGVRLRFAHKRVGWEWDDPMSAVFVDHTYADGVAISADGMTWYRAHELRASDTLTNEYRQFEVELDPLLAAHGLAYNNRFLIRFQQSDYFMHPYGGRAFDHIEVVAPCGNLRLEQAACEVPENAGAVTLAVVRVDGSAGVVAVDYASTDATAEEGSDYLEAAGTLVFSNGVLRREVVVPVLDDGAVEPPETFVLTLFNPAGGAALLAPTQAEVTLADDDGPGRLEFAEPAYTEQENGGYAAITVVRRYGTNGVVTVDYRTAAGSATPGVDYTEITGTLTFDAGVQVQTFEVPLLDDTAQEPNETVALFLERPLGGADLGPRTNAWLTILDDERPRAAFPFYENFEITPSNCWQMTCAGAGRIQLSGNGTPLEGSRQLALDSAVEGSPGLNEAVLTVDLSGQTSVIFRCWTRELQDPLEPMPELFTNSIAADGIAFSHDGIHWHRLAALPAAGGASTSTGIVADLVALAAARGVPLTPTFQIKLQQYGTQPLGTQGRCFDHFSLAPAENTTATVIRAQGFEGQPGDTWDFRLVPGAGAVGLRADRKWTGRNALKITGSNNQNADPYVEFENVPLAGYNHVQLRVAFSVAGADSSDDLYLDLSYNNGDSWNGAGSVKLVDGYNNMELAFGATNPAYTVAANPWVVDLPAGCTQVKVRLRFDEKSGSNASLDSYFLDDLVLSYQPTGQPPRLVVPPNQAVLVSNRLEFTVSASDIDGDAIELSARGLPAGAEFNTVTNPSPATQVFRFTPDAGQDGGVYTIQFAAGDKDGADEQAVVLTVRDKEVRFLALRTVTAEEAGCVTVGVAISRAADAVVQVTALGTADAADLALAPTTLVFTADGPTVQDVRCDVRDDDLAEGPETLRLNLVPGPGVRLRDDTHDLWIRDDDSVTLAAANLTSDGTQKYQPAGARILQAVKPDITAIQEFNVTNAGGARAFVDLNFGPEFDFYREADGTLPNGVISRWPIVAAGEWADPHVGDRDYAWATIAIPGGRRLHVVSVHLSASGGASERRLEAMDLTNYLQAADFHPGDYVALCGDFNTQTRYESALQVLETALCNDRVPADQDGDPDTNQNRDKPYDYVLANARLNQRHQPLTFAGRLFQEGLVFDTRLWAEEELPYPAQAYDSAAPQMQHMIIVKAFALDLFATLATRVGAHGALEPLQPEVGLGSNQEFRATADPFYHVALLQTNGRALPAASPAAEWTWTWSNVTANGWLDVAFAENLTVHDVPEWWLARYGLTNADWETEALGDTDGDRFAAWQEYWADTDPTNAESALVIRQLEGGATAQLAFPASTARVYTLHYATPGAADGDWAPLASGLRATNQWMTLTDTNGAALRMYRIEVGPAP